jgi:hypothetical protein
MSIEDLELEARIRDDLHATVVPPTLAPPADLAGSVLHDLRRQRRTRMLVTALASVAALAAGAVAVPAGLSRLDSGTGPDIVAVEPGTPSSLPFPRPGGGPQAIQAYGFTARTNSTFLLDPVTGRYLEYPFEHAVLSPDLTMLAVVGPDGPGVVERSALFRDGMSAIQPVDRPDAFGRPVWSPDETAVLFSSMYKDDASRTTSFTAHRYDVDTGRITDTPINLDLLGTSVGWAADSTRYLALERGAQGNDTVDPGPLRYIEPDGTLGEPLVFDGGYVGGAESYSPSGEYVFVHASDIMTEQPVTTRVLDVATGEVVATLPGDRAVPIGWYDDTTVALITRHGTPEVALELVDITTDEVTERIPLRGLPDPRTLQIGSSEGLTGAAEEFGF